MDVCICKKVLYILWKLIFFYCFFMIFFCLIIKEILNIYLFNIFSIVNYLYVNFYFF